MSERKILEESIEDHQKAIDKAKKELAALEVTYSVGDRFKSRDKYILACTDTNYNVHLVNLAHGSHLSNSTRVENTKRITQSEFNRILASNLPDPVRYWDARKKVKV